ncbi:hypothetical protein Leryth_020213 [Lithospermum erythrorhizon]|nr:hypothetical protein Leryth_020213 [Lithospermum erythrorhizon]
MSIPSSKLLFTPYQLGKHLLSHRIVMSPMTRNRSFDAMPQKHAILYYSQRTSPGGFIVTEATGVSDTAQGYPHLVFGQRNKPRHETIVDAVHAKRVVSSFVNCGMLFGEFQTKEIFYELLKLNGAQITSSFQPNGQDPISSTTKGFTPAVRFDGIELHGAHGYLLEQFLKDNVNDRTDNKYGGFTKNAVVDSFWN